MKPAPEARQSDACCAVLNCAAWGGGPTAETLRTHWCLIRCARRVLHQADDIRRLVIEDFAPLLPGRKLTELQTTFASRSEVEQSVRSANPTMSEAAVQGRVDVYYQQQPSGTWRFRADVAVGHGRGESDAEKSWQNARRVQAPTLVIRAGAEPPLVSQETAERLSRENPHIQVVTVPGAGHNIHFPHFDAFMTHLRQVLSEPVGAYRMST